MAVAIREIDHIVLRVIQLDLMIRFYCDVPGCCIERRQAGQGATGPCLLPPDQAAIRARLAAHGVQAGPAEARYGAEGEGPSIYLQDPERNTIELKGPARVQ